MQNALAEPEVKPKQSELSQFAYIYLCCVGCCNGLNVFVNWVYWREPLILTNLMRCEWGWYRNWQYSFPSWKSFARFSQTVFSINHSFLTGGKWYGKPEMGELKMSDYLDDGLKIQSVFSFKLKDLLKYRGSAFLGKLLKEMIILFSFSGQNNLQKHDGQPINYKFQLTTIVSYYLVLLII